jgi:hypothetical protein
MNFSNKDIKDVNIMKPEPRKEGIKLLTIKREKKEGQNSSIIYTFEDKNKAMLQHREFDPNRLESMSDEEWEKSQKLAHSRVAHISRAYLTQEEFDNIQGATWIDYVKATFVALGVNMTTGEVAKAKAIDADGKTALKVVFKFVKKDSKYYASLPQVPPFISTSNHVKDFTTNPQYDIYEIPSIKPDGARATPGAGGAATGDLKDTTGGGNDFGGEF